MKIKSIEKVYDVFEMRNGGKLYSKGVKLDNGEWAKIVTYTDTIQVEAGTEFIEGQNCDRIKEEVKSYERDGQQNSYKQFTIYAKKKEWSGGKGGGFKKISMSEFEFAVNHCLGLSLSLGTVDGQLDNNLSFRYFDVLLNNMIDHVELVKPEDKTVDAVKGEFASDPFDKGGLDVPF